MSEHARSNQSISIDTILTDDLENATTVVRWTEVMSDAAGQLGFSPAWLTLDISDLRTGGRAEAGRTHSEFWSTDFLDHWHQNRCKLLNPINHVSRNTPLPFSWGRHDDDWSVSIDLDRRQRKVMDLIFDLGITGGIAVPVYLPKARIGVMTWACRGEVALRQRAQALRWPLTLISHAALQSLMPLVADGGGPDSMDSARLTAREIECVNWVASGKSDEDIGCIMGLSYSAVRFHLNNAARKLNCINRGHLVARAVQQGWITSLA